MPLDWIERILSLPELTAEPPVLVEIGAAGGTHRPWRTLAPYATCIAFDPDSRQMDSVHAETGGYRRLQVIPAAAVAEEIDEVDFHLTRSPQCSSLLHPDAAALNDWDFARLFDVERTARVPCVSLPKALAKAGVSRVDWFKTDSQGIDLRLFQSLGEPVCRRILAAEFEPGIIDAYEGEDKLSSVLSFLDRRDFWLSDMRVRGTLRMSPDDAQRIAGHEAASLASVLPKSPGWVEMTYLNTFRGGENFSRRDWLLGWVIATLHDRPGFALDLALRGKAACNDGLFDELATATERSIRARLRRSRPGSALRRGARKLRSILGRLTQ